MSVIHDAGVGNEDDEIHRALPVRVALDDPCCCVRLYEAQLTCGRLALRGEDAGGAYRKVWFGQARRSFAVRFAWLISGLSVARMSKSSEPVDSYIWAGSSASSKHRPP